MVFYSVCSTCGKRTARENGQMPHCWEHGQCNECHTFGMRKKGLGMIL